jgi:protein-disulfide isomerase
LPINRREFCQGAATTVMFAAAFGTALLPSFPAQAQESVSIPELMAPQALPDFFLGDAKAPVAIVEYASMTCPHCAHFSETTFPELKKRYIDTGKVRYVLREFPLDPLAAAGFMLARCAGDPGGDGTGNKDPGKYYAMVDTLFRQQTQWVKEKPLPPLLAIAKQAGFTEESFNACLANQKLLDDIQKVRQTAIDKFKVRSTPTFFIDGKSYAGTMTIEELAKIIDKQPTGK